MSFKLHCDICNKDIGATDRYLFMKIEEKNGFKDRYKNDRGFAKNIDETIEFIVCLECINSKSMQEFYAHLFKFKEADEGAMTNSWKLRSDRDQVAPGPSGIYQTKRYKIFAYIEKLLAAIFGL